MFKYALYDNGSDRVADDLTSQLPDRLIMARSKVAAIREHPGCAVVLFSALSDDCKRRCFEQFRYEFPKAPLKATNNSRSSRANSRRAALREQRRAIVEQMKKQSKIQRKARESWHDV